MKHSSPYLKMRVLGAIDSAEGKNSRERVANVSKLTFTDEEGIPRKFTWRTISTWLYRYKNHGITGVTSQSRKDKGKPRKITPEELLEAVNSARPHFRSRYNPMAIYRFCIEKGLLRKEQIAQTTFYRFIRQYELLKNDDETKNKMRMAFAMQYANQLWQADTMFGPYVNDSGKHKQTKLIAFIDDASRVACHGEFFFEENIDSLIKALKSAFYKRGIPEQLYVDNGSIYSCQEITLICARIGCILRHTPVRDGSAKGKIERFFRRVRDQFLSRNLDLSSLETLNRQGKSLVTIIDDAHLMEMNTLRKLRLLFEDFPKNHNVILIGQPSLLNNMSLSVNSDIKTIVTYSTIMRKLNPDDMKNFILGQLDRVKLGHNIFSEDAIELIVRSCEGILRKARNLCIGCMLEAVRLQEKQIGLENVNRVLIQPHWRQDYNLAHF